MNTHLEAGALVGELPHSLHGEIDQLLPNSVVAARIVVRRVLFARQELLGVEQLAIRSRPYLVCG